MTLAAAAAALVPPAEAAGPLLPVTVAVPGPRTLSYLPIDLMPRIGADRAEGLALRIQYVGGGAVALESLQQHATDFVVAGVPAMMSHRLHGGEVTVLAAVDDRPLFVLMVRSDLRGQVRTVGDLRGRVVGVNTSSLSSKTTSQQLLEAILAEAHVPADGVRLVPAGQSWQAQAATLGSGTGDAVMGDEPFASRLLAAGKVFFLVNLGEPGGEAAAGGAFLHAALGTRPDVLARDPDKVGRLVAALRRTLQWLAGHRPEEIVDALEVPDGEERASLLQALRKYGRLYSPDGRLSTRQLAATERFFRRTAGEGAGRLAIESMVADKWAGRKE